MRPPLLSARIARGERLAADADVRCEPVLQHRDRHVWNLALIVQLFELLESAAEQGREEVGRNGTAAKQSGMLFVCHRELVIELFDLALCAIKVLSQLFLVAFLERRRDLAIYFIDLFIEGAELLLRVFELCVQRLTFVSPSPPDARRSGSARCRC